VRNVWFKNQGTVLEGELMKRYQSNEILKRWAWHPGAITKTLEGLLPNYPLSVLIPPLREPELSININTSQEVQPSGPGLINYLHFAKNQYSGSDLATYNTIQSAFTRVTSGFGFVIQPNRNNQIALFFGTSQGTLREAAACGRGLIDVLLILYFAVHPKWNLVLIEEPESHVHPDMQRRLLSFLREQHSKQFFLTTHSNVFLDGAFVDRVLFTSYSGDKVVIDDATGRARILSDLGYAVTDNLVSDLVILVEGPKDAPIVEEFLVKLGLWEKFAIKVWPLGGDIMDQLDLSVFAEHYRMIALLDQDPGSKGVREKFEAKCAQYKIPVVRLKRRAIENYFTLAALRKVFGKQIPSELESLDHDVPVVKQLGLNPKGNSRAIARAMDLKDIEGTDLMGFFNKAGELLAST